MATLMPSKQKATVLSIADEKLIVNKILDTAHSKIPLEIVSALFFLRRLEQSLAYYPARPVVR